jgi:hypothetical protein
LLQSREHKHGGLSQSRFGLAEDICSQDGLRNAYLLDCSERISRVRRDDCQKANAFDEWSVHVLYPSCGMEIQPPEPTASHNSSISS